jgi:hypothetical protein
MNTLLRIGGGILFIVTLYGMSYLPTVVRSHEWWLSPTLVLMALFMILSLSVALFGPPPCLKVDR